MLCLSVSNRTLCMYLLQLFSNFCHQALSIFWTIIVAVVVGHLVDFLPMGHIQFLALLIGPTYP
jgi:hypothetical protein